MSPAALKALFQARQITPESVMLAKLAVAKAERASRSTIRKLNKALTRKTSAS
jgi:hypothetical protein